MSALLPAPLVMARQFREAADRFDKLDRALLACPDDSPTRSQLQHEHGDANRQFMELGDAGLEAEPANAADAAALLTFVFEGLEIINASDPSGMCQMGFLERKLKRITLAVARCILTLGRAEGLDFSAIGDPDLQVYLRRWVPEEGRGS